MSNKNTPRSPATSLSNLFSDRVIPHDDLQTLKVLGSGQFGTVELALHKKSGTKMVSKARSS